MLYLRFILGSKPSFFPLLVALCPLSHSVCALPLNQFSCCSKKVFKRISKKSIRIKKKKLSFLSCGIKEKMVGNTIGTKCPEKVGTDVAEKKIHIRCYEKYLL